VNKTTFVLVVAVTVTYRVVFLVK